MILIIQNITLQQEELFVSFDGVKDEAETVVVLDCNVYDRFNLL